MKRTTENVEFKKQFNPPKKILIVLLSILLLALITITLLWSTGIISKKQESIYSYCYDHYYSYEKDFIEGRSIGVWLRDRNHDNIHIFTYKELTTEEFEATDIYKKVSESNLEISCIQFDCRMRDNAVFTTYFLFKREPKSNSEPLPCGLAVPDVNGQYQIYFADDPVGMINVMYQWFMYLEKNYAVEDYTKYNKRHWYHYGDLYEYMPYVTLKDLIYAEMNDVIKKDLLTKDEMIRYVLDRKLFLFKEVQFPYYKIFSDISTCKAYYYDYTIEQILNETNFSQMQWDTKSYMSNNNYLIFTGVSTIFPEYGKIEIEFLFKEESDLPIINSVTISNNPEAGLSYQNVYGVTQNAEEAEVMLEAGCECLLIIFGKDAI